MNRRDHSTSNAANAIVELDCPWCSEPVRATETEFAHGRVCSACLVRIEFHAGTVVEANTMAIPAAA